MEELRPLLEELAKQLGTTVEYLWSVTVAQAQVYAISYVAYFTLWIIVAFILYKSSKIFAYRLEKDEDSWECIASFLVGAISLITVIGLGLSLIFDFRQFLTALLNPEYWALQQILEAISR